MIVNFGKITLGEMNIPFKGTDTLVWQNTYRKGSLGGGHQIRIYYDTSATGNLFEIEIYENGVLITTSGQLVHAKNTRKICDLVHVWDPTKEYTIKVISKTSSECYLKNVQVKDYETIADKNGVDRIFLKVRGTSSVTGTGSATNKVVTLPYTFINQTFASAIVENASPAPSLGATLANNTSTVTFTFTHLDFSAWYTTINFVYKVEGAVQTPLLIT